MAINLILPDEITTSAEREKVDRMMREVQNYRMKPEEDIIQHLITVNQKMQKVLWKGHELIRKNKVQFLTLRGILIEREHQMILDQLWKTLLFTELSDVEQTKDLTPLGEEHGAQEPCMVVPISYVDNQSTVRHTDIDLNAAPKTAVVLNDVYDSNDPFDHEVDSDNDPDVDEVLDDIDDESVNDDGSVNASSNENLIRRIVIHNNPGAHMLLINPDAMHAAEFSKYPNILPAHRLAVDSDPEVLFVGQKFKSKERCVFPIKRYSMNVSVDYKVTVLESVEGRRKATIGRYEPHLSKSRRCGRYENLLGLTHALQHAGYLSAKNGVAPVLVPRSMLNSLSMRCILSSTRCMSGRMSFPSSLTCLHERCIRRLSSLSQTKGCIGIRKRYIFVVVGVHVVGDRDDECSPYSNLEGLVPSAEQQASVPSVPDRCRLSSRHKHFRCRLSGRLNQVLLELCGKRVIRAMFGGGDTTLTSLTFTIQNESFTYITFKPRNSNKTRSVSSDDVAIRGGFFSSLVTGVDLRAGPLWLVAFMEPCHQSITSLFAWHKALKE
ncbi:hypothetical protein GOBAR_DD00798 [Gossypium barbadense]|nr:hypothetical protein GOBAR_DD00798 [Gossypium barbadense]